MHANDIKNTLLPVVEIQRFCMHDGPGVRTTVFLKGCPLRCEWCHNPETQKSVQEILFDAKKCIGCGACEAFCPNNAQKSAENRIFHRDLCTVCERCASVCPTEALYTAKKDMSVGEILAIVEKDCAFYGDNGGITLSGGEPLMHAESVLTLLKECKAAGITTCIETCGHFDSEKIPDIVKHTDTFLFDIKDTARERHKKYTGKSNELILKNLRLIDEAGGRTRLRCILVNRVNAYEEHYLGIAKTASNLKNCEGVEIIPYHAYGGSKMLLLGQDDNGNMTWIPSKEECDRAKTTLIDCGIKVF